MQDYRKLQIWQRSHVVTLQVYRVTTSFPNDEKFGLVSQMRRSTSSIPTNIAEGSGRGSNADFVRFLYIAMGSAAELDYQLLLANELNFLKDEAYATLANELTEIQRMLNAFIQRLKTNN